VRIKILNTIILAFKNKLRKEILIRGWDNSSEESDSLKKASGENSINNMQLITPDSQKHVALSKAETIIIYG